MATVKQLIEQLQAIEDQDQVVIFQYYVREDFEYADNTEFTDEVFEEVADWAVRVDVWEDAMMALNDRIYELAKSNDED